MKVVILAGGKGTRLSEETMVRPKPMVEIGEMPILWHIMKYFSRWNLNEFVVCLGYKGYMIKEYFAHYSLHSSDITFDMQNENILIHRNKVEPWKITLVDTGNDTQTAGRLKRISPYLDNGTFMLTYGDGLSDININKLLEFHAGHKKLATVTGVKPKGRFGVLGLDDNGLVNSFHEKPAGDGGWVNGGFFVLEPEILRYIQGDATNFETDTMPLLSSKNELFAFLHDGFWHPMDMLRDRIYLESLWQNGTAPWKTWE